MADRSETEAGNLSQFTPIRRFQLRVLAGADEGLRHVATRDRVLVGSGADCDVQLNDPTVSRAHCELLSSGGRISIKDLGSRNGTFVNGVSVTGANLISGSIVRVGRTELVLESRRMDTTPSVGFYERDSFGALVGRSKEMQAVFTVLEQAAACDVTLLIQGETGTGKDLAAKAVHEASARADGPLIVVDCGAIAPQLLEGELFGHQKGAFTGADRARAGVFESASGGTVFLDEIGELPLDLQPKLLRVLEQREVRRLGATQVTPLDVRFIAATNRNLADEVKAGRMRADLYYRLSVTEVTMPPLRERKQDLPLLVDAILDQIGAGDNSEALFGGEEFLAELHKHTWPGNARELRNYIERCVALQRYVAPTLLTQAEHEMVANPIDITVPLKELRERWVDKFEKQYLEAVLRANGNNVTAAARAAGLNRAHFHRLLAHHGLRGGGQ